MSNPEYEEIKGAVAECERPIPNYSEYMVKNPAIPNKPRGVDLFTPAQAGGLMDIIYGGDQWVDQGVPTKRKNKTHEVGMCDVSPAEEADTLSPLQQDIENRTGNHHGEMDAQLGDFVRNYLYATS